MASRSRQVPGFSDYEERDLWRATRAYYDDNQTIVDISNELGLTRAKVYELLERARRDKVVDIRFNPPRMRRLETLIIDKFGLRDCVVVEGPASVVSRAAALYFQRTLRNVLQRLSHTKERRAARLSLACGRALYRMEELLDGDFDPFDGLPSANGHRVLEIYPANVAIGPKIVSYYPNLLVARLKSNLEEDSDAQHSKRIAGYNLFVPPLTQDEEGDERPELDELSKLESEQLRDEAWNGAVTEFHLKYLAKHGIRRYFERAMQADIYAFGIGSMEDLNEGFLQVAQYCYEGSDVDPDDLRKRLAAQAIGEIGYQPFNELGFGHDDFVRLRTRQINVPWTVLRDASRHPERTVMAVVSGDKKARAVRVSLARNLLIYNVLITDSRIAESLVEG